jgi:hypothetical protein
MEKLIILVLMKISKKKISLYSLYLKTINRQYIYSAIEDSEVVLFLNVIMQVEETLKFCLKDKWLICLPYCHVYLKYVLNNSPPASAEVRKMWIYTATPPYAFMA